VELCTDRLEPNLAKEVIDNELPKEVDSANDTWPETCEDPRTDKDPPKLALSPAALKLPFMFEDNPTDKFEPRRAKQRNDILLPSC
jgi:hypothetical protein